MKKPVSTRQWFGDSNAEQTAPMTTIGSCVRSAWAYDWQKTGAFGIGPWSRMPGRTQNSERRTSNGETLPRDPFASSVSRSPVSFPTPYFGVLSSEFYVPFPVPILPESIRFQENIIGIMCRSAGT